MHPTAVRVSSSGYRRRAEEYREWPPHEQAHISHESSNFTDLGAR
jgi:hypothetical protein